MKDPAVIKETVEGPILKYDLEHLEGFTPDLPTLENAYRLVLRSTAFYANEEDRESPLRETLKDLLPERANGDDQWRTGRPSRVRFGSKDHLPIWFLS